MPSQAPDPLPPVYRDDRLAHKSFRPHHIGRCRDRRLSLARFARVNREITAAKQRTHAKTPAASKANGYGYRFIVSAGDNTIDQSGNYKLTCTVPLRRTNGEWADGQ